MRRIARLLDDRKLTERKSGAMEKKREEERITPETEYLPTEKGRRNEGMEQKNNNREQQQKQEGKLKKKKKEEEKEETGNRRRRRG